MANQKLKVILTLLLPLTVFISSCVKDDPVPEINQEVITDLTLRFTALDESDTPIAGDFFEVKASDEEGISLGNSPQVGTISGLEPGRKYQLEVFLYNSIANEDVTEEVAEDDEAHQFYFLGTALLGNESFLSYSYGDTDQNGNPLGLVGVVSVNEAPAVNTGTFRLILRHNLNKDLTAAQNPNFEAFEQAGGESDLDVTFQVLL